MRLGVKGSGRRMLRGKADRIKLRIWMQLGGITLHSWKWYSHRNSGKSCKRTNKTRNVPFSTTWQSVTVVTSNCTVVYDSLHPCYTQGANMCAVKAASLGAMRAQAIWNALHQGPLMAEHQAHSLQQLNESKDKAEMRAWLQQQLLTLYRRRTASVSSALRR